MCRAVIARGCVPNPSYDRVVTAPAAPRGTIIMPAEIDARFGDGSLFRHSAYRLELLDEYDAPSTRMRVARFLGGQPDDAEVRAYWAVPLSDYMARGFGTMWP